jgi:predicted kinase
MSIEVSAPWLVALKGYPGCGKSTVAAALSRELGWPLIEKDAIQRILDRHRVAGDAPGYEIMLQLARSHLRHGISIILDSPFWKLTYDNAQALADEHGARLVVIECRCADEAEWRRRIGARQGDGSPVQRTTTWESLQEFRRRYDSETYAITVPHLVVDTSTEQPETVADIRAWLQRLATRPDAGHTATESR